MKDLIVSLFGEYIPVTYEVIVDGVTQIVIADGVAGVDWPYVLGILIFVVVLSSVLRGLNGLLSRK